MERMKELINILNEASKAYYQLNSEIMSDFEYDRLYDELVGLENETGTVYANSPTRKVGYELLTALKKIKHESKMLSLDKTKEVSKLAEFLGESKGILSYKMDGLTTVLTYEDGRLIQAVTRGNGETGEDITHNARFFGNIPVEIGFKEKLIIRGEAVIAFEEFERINEKLPIEEKYKNPRNLCSGTVRQLNSEISSSRRVDFIAFSMLTQNDSSNSKKQQLKWLSEIGFEVVENEFVTADTIADIVKKFEDRIPQNKYATDGLVLTFDDIAYSRSLGSTSKFPKDSIAFKWADETAETILEDIEWSTSRTGLINPVAVFKAVELEGTTVNRASVHNISIIENLMLGKGDKIIVYKANMIIPQISENLTKSNTAVIPEKCPVCGKATEIVSLRDGKALRCTNPNCHARLVLSIVHYASRDALNIEGLAESIVERLIKLGCIENYTDVYRLSEHREKIVSTKGFGEASYNNMISAVEKSKKCNIANFIYGLGINHVGLSNAKLLVKHFENDIEKIISADVTELTNIDGFGEIIAKSTADYFNDETNIKLLRKALEYIEFEQTEQVSTDSEISGKVFVVTGDVYKFKNRKELQARIEQLGGKVTSSVSSKTDYLINNDINSPSSKNKKAKELNVPIITEDKFIEIAKLDF